MQLFSEWTIDEAKRVLSGKGIVRPKKAKHAAVAHTEIDRWLKSVDGLAKDLKDLQGAKKKAQDKMNQIGQKYKPEDKPEEKPDDKHKEEKPDERKSKQSRPEADREVLRQTRREKPAPKPDRGSVGRAADDDEVDSLPKPKRVIRSKIEPAKRRTKSRPVEDEDME